MQIVITAAFFAAMFQLAREIGVPLALTWLFAFTAALKLLVRWR